MKMRRGMFPIIAVGTLAGALVLPSPVKAQSREHSWEFVLPVIYSPSTTVTGEGGSKADLNSDLGFGFGIGYNPSNHFQVNGMFTWSTRSYDATIANTDGTARKASGTLESSTIAINAMYFLNPTGVTPFISGGIGSTFVDSNIPNGLGQTTCWYDPWWGYICDTYTPTKSETAVSYTAGVGVRIPVNRAFSVQASYNKLWLDLNNSKPDIDGWKLDFVFRM
jgi:opacity protein-like surface antigen